MLLYCPMKKHMCSVVAIFLIIFLRLKVLGMNCSCVLKQRSQCWSSNNLEDAVHFVKLGPGAVRVWVDVIKVTGAAVWMPNSEIEYMEDALGTSIAWSEDKIIML